MGGLLPILLLVLAGVLVGGALSLHRQGAPRAVVLTTSALAMLAAVAGGLWLLPGEGS
ncbi:hypothetical protein [Salinispora arenicola]|uniref:Uncharacterized protein n=1 Tax=Salinispora arenicola TaxID=168697 RepID=A0A542XQ87_SALAC|nr:hypothetical protein [Salinispora arenicola]MCN0151433.1 hypothetical protein [Salinispora arenicola]NIL40308.1 hypothetical protein [Salinispora arenicola]TQL37813.1 hypothetical protein FB564_2982 [Salinispora arenicola]GIM86138.1 hypothetical protein Sar04_28740 [Salinispora arenicola]